MKQVLIDDDIADYGVTAARIRDQLATVQPGEEIQIVIASAGGSVFEGVALFNVIKDFAQAGHPVSVLIQGLAASMASYVALAAKSGNQASEISVEENAIFVIHNPYTISMGDYKALQKDAVTLERLAALLASTYTAITKKSNDEIRSAMDEETYYIGQEIVDAGFADKVIPIPESDTAARAALKERKGLLASAKLNIDRAYKKAEKDHAHDSLEKAVALLSTEPIQEPAASAAGAINTNPATAGTTEDRMNPEELLAKFPDCYKAVLARGVEQERKRVDAHLKMGEASKSYETAAKYIRDGSSLGDDNVIADYQVIAMKNRAISARGADDPKGLLHQDEKGGKEEMLASLDKEIGGVK
jgi:Protease subunit of ATP-dependent Clp proteases